jgi:hypothetical protein
MSIITAGTEKHGKPFVNLRSLSIVVRRFAPLRLCLILFFVVSNTHAADLRAGIESPIDAALAGGPMKVFLPSNYDASNSWPVVFFYPGQDAQPETTTIRKFCDDRDFIVVGLPHVAPRPAPKSSDAPPHYIEKLRDDFAKARTWVCANVRADTNRIFVGGVSKGGWTASLVGEPEMRNIAGLILLLAGRSFPTTASPGGNYHFKYIYIGDGDADANLRPARQAFEFFVRYGADVTFEEFQGTGHSMPGDAPYLRAWLRVHGPLWRDRDHPVAEIGLWFTNSLTAVNGTADHGEKYKMLRTMTGDPRFLLCARNDYSLVSDILTVSAGMQPARDDWAAERAYRSLLWKESKIATLDDMLIVRDGFLVVSTNFPATRFGKLAAEDFALVDAAYQKSLAATRAANAQPTNRAPQTITPATKSDRPDRPGGPVIDGNKIKFRR